MDHGGDAAGSHPGGHAVGGRQPHPELIEIRLENDGYQGEDAVFIPEDGLQISIHEGERREILGQEQETGEGGPPEEMDHSGAMQNQAQDRGAPGQN